MTQESFYARKNKQIGTILGIASFAIQTLLAALAVAAVILSDWTLPSKVFVASVGSLWLLKHMLRELAGEETNDRRFLLQIEAMEALERKIDGKSSESVDGAMRECLRRKDISDIAGGTAYFALLILIGTFLLIFGGGWLLSQIAAPYI